MSNTPEGKVKRKIDEWLNQWMPGHWKVKPRGGPFGKAGCPDILICWMGIFIGIEVKSDTGEASAMQMMNLKMIQKAGGIAALVRGFDVPRLIAIRTAVIAKRQHLQEEGWDAALRVHATHGMAGWSDYKIPALRGEV